MMTEKNIKVLKRLFSVEWLSILFFGIWYFVAGYIGTYFPNETLGMILYSVTITIIAIVFLSSALSVLCAVIIIPITVFESIKEKTLNFFFENIGTALAIGMISALPLTALVWTVFGGLL